MEDDIIQSFVTTYDLSVISEFWFLFLTIAQAPSNFVLDL
jgi:hypothetical protein